MKINKKLLSFISVILLVGANQAQAEIKQGDKLQALVTLHPDIAKRVFYTTNYQLPGGLIAPCTEITVQKINKKKMLFIANGIEYTMAYDKHTKKAGISFQQAVGEFFGASCESKKIAGLGQKDKDGIKSGAPSVGMTKQGVLFAMGRPPHHANPSLESNSWMYWQNRFNRVVLEFDDKGVLTTVRN